MVAMETMHFFIVQLSLSLRAKILCISGVPMNDLAPMKNCPGGGGGCKVGQISSRGKGHIFSIFPRKKKQSTMVTFYGRCYNVGITIYRKQNRIEYFVEKENRIMATDFRGGEGGG